MQPNKRTWLAVFAIGVLTFLAHDFWAWSDPVSIGPMGLPRWIFVFVGLQIGLAVVIYWYDRHREASDDSTSEGDEA